MKAISIAAATMLFVGLATSSRAASPVDNAVDLTGAVSGWTYYNRPGATLETQVADLKYCISIAPLTTQAKEGVKNPEGGVLGMIIGDMIIGKMIDTDVRRGVAANIENCMVVRGWRVIQISNEEGDRLSKLDQATLAEQLKPLVGAEAPEGRIARTWDNDALKAKTKKFSQSPGRIDHVSLSINALPRDLPPPPPRPELGVRPPNSAWPPRNLKADQLAGVTLGPDEALIIARIKHPGIHNGMGLELERRGPDPDTPAWFADQKPFDIFVWTGFLAVKADGNDYAYVVPAGTWRLAAIYNTFGPLSLCFGAPAFSVKPGEVVFIGAFDMAADEVQPEFNLDPAKALLAKAPSLQAKVKVAAWENGYTAVCDGTFLYAAEFKGVPSRADYVRGAAPLPKGPRARKPIQY